MNKYLYVAVYTNQCQNNPLVFDPFNFSLQSGVTVNATSEMPTRPIIRACVNNSHEEGYWLPQVDDFDPNITVCTTLTQKKLLFFNFF